MAVIVFPTTGWDSFVSETEATTLLTSYVPTTELTKWNELDTAQREVYLRQATSRIKASITLPDDNSQDLKLATAYLANYMTASATSGDNSGNIKKKTVEGIGTEEYFTESKDTDDFPEFVSNLLEQFNATQSGAFKFERG